MAAPTPLSAYTDGLATGYDATMFVLGVLTVILSTACVGYLLWLAILGAEEPLRRRWTSRRLHREHARSGRG